MVPSPAPSAVDVDSVDSGDSVLQIQLKASCMVRIATSGMYYPGTMERAVLVAGEIDGVKVGRKTTQQWHRYRLHV